MCPGLITELRPQRNSLLAATVVIVCVVITGKYSEYQELSSRLQGGDGHYLEQHLRAHVSRESPMASLKSR